MPGTEATRGTDQPECLKSMCLVNILPMWPYTSMLEPEVYGSYSSHNTGIFLTSQHCLPWKLHPTDLVPQFTWVIGSRAVHTAPSANTKFFCSSSNLLPFKTTLNLILITTKTNCNPLRRLFVETSVPYNGNAVLRGFKRFSGSITEAVARAWAVWHYIIVVTCWSFMHIAWAEQSKPIPTVVLRIRELACSNSMEFPMSYGEGNKAVTMLIWPQNSLHLGMHCLKINVWNRRHYH